MPALREFINESMLITGMLLLLWPVTGSAQQQSGLRAPHALSGNEHIERPLNNRLQAVSDSLEIVAVRIAFQPDENRFTTGDGTFRPGSLAYLDRDAQHIDPLPHDRAYFEAHLEFAANYFRKASDDNLSITYRVLPQVYRLDRPMAYYAPTGETFDNRPLAELARDVWETVDREGGLVGERTSENRAYLIFHAGVGRDIELVGTNLDKTPQDIPSIYLGREALEELLNEPGFEGFSVNGGATRVTNTLILPRTLSRPGTDITGSRFVLQLSINGLLCATIGSHLGLPDLFDTSSGSSGIGQFGLMDGASIFSYNGLFPPEPSAWEKIRMGWATPFPVTAGEADPVQLPAGSLSQISPSIARYDLSDGEYFLVENRHRDTQGDGALLTFRLPDGSLETRTYGPEDQPFANREPGFEKTLPKGVLVDIDEPDWSLPGGPDPGADGQPGTPDDRILNGGILIWHIDRAAINRQLGSGDGGVNDNPGRRGVDLEEADGSQDIGRTNETLFTDFSRGTPFDFWWPGNDASVITQDNDTLSLYRNRFGPDTTPDNASNSGAPSSFEFFGFSENAAVASFRIRAADRAMVQSVTLPADRLPQDEIYTAEDDSYWAGYPLSLATYESGQDTFLVIPTPETAYALQLSGGNDALHDFNTGPVQQPLITESVLLGDKPEGAAIDIVSHSWDGQAWQTDWNETAEANRGFLSSVDGQTLLLDLTQARFRLSDGARLPDLSGPRQRSAGLGGTYTVLTPDLLQLAEGTELISLPPQTGLRYTGAVPLDNATPAFYLLEQDRLLLLDPADPGEATPLINSESTGWPAMTDFDGDHRTDFLYINRNRNRLEAVNANGAFLPGFPVHPPAGSRFAGTPLVADLDGDGSLNLLTVVQDSLSMNIYAYGRDGTVMPEFQLYVGTVSDPANEPVHPVLSGRTLYAVSHGGNLRAWHFPGMDRVPWRSRYGNSPYNKVSGQLASGSDPTPVTGILDRTETYNWPNPARDETYIRYRTSEAGTVEITVMTVSGRVIYNREFPASGGSAEEQRIATDGWGSGIYLARVTATVNGQTARKLIKIAVVH